MEEAVAREVALLLETQPRTTSFRRHLAAMSKSFAKEGSDCQKTLSTLLSKASAGHGTATTIKFFAELARHRGFTGDVIDKTWAHLDEHHAQEMALDFMRRAPQLLVTQVARTFAKVGMEANAKSKIISRQKETLMEVRKKLSAALETGRDMKLEASRLRSQLSAAHESERKMEEDATELFFKMAEEHDRERDAAAKEAAGLSSELTDLRKKLALEMDAREKSEKAVEVAKKEMTELRAALSSAHEEEVDGLTVELAGVEKLLAEEGERWRDAAEQCSDSLDKAILTSGEEMESCRKERLEHEQRLASLSGSNDQCECPEIEVPTIEAGGNDSQPDVPTPSEPG